MSERLADRRREVTAATELLAHSALSPGAAAQTYRAHIAGTSSSEGVVAGALRRARSMVHFLRDKEMSEPIIAAIIDAAIFHDLGKLDPEVQRALQRGRAAKLGWDHIDAGVAHLRARGAFMAAWIVRAHHAPGLPSLPTHFTASVDRHLRGRRDDADDPQRHQAQIERTDRYLSSMLADHTAAIDSRQPLAGKALHGLTLRLSLSCLVDSDHSDTATSDTGRAPPEPPEPRWHERLAALDAYVGKLGDGIAPRDEARRAFYQACRTREPDVALMACEGPVGIGKTTAVTAYLLRRAIATGARRLFVVAPYTAILSQTARTLREALVLADERDQPDKIVAEHHHRADFNDISSRDLATLWSTPIILTTAVQFFETLASNAPSLLRKLHSLPGSVVFLDEAHAALPTHLWPQNWRWLRELAENWSSSFVFASGSLARFWEVEDIVGDARMTLPDLVPVALQAPLRHAEAARVSYISTPRFDGPLALANAVAAAPGPRLLIMNTVQSAAVMARDMRQAGHDVLHLSTALCPGNRDAVLKTVRERLEPVSSRSDDWTLVATSLMEAGVDVSFRTPFRERFSTASLIQIGGRGNRNFEWPGGVTVYDFIVSHVDGLTAHPAANKPANILADLFARGKLQGEVDPAQLVTYAMQLERPQRDNTLLAAEKRRCYPEVAELGRVIDADTRLVVVDPTLRDRIERRDRVTARDLLSGSVQIWAKKLDWLGLQQLPGRREIYWWPHKYDPLFLGYMAGALFLHGISAGEALIA